MFCCLFSKLSWTIFDGTFPHHPWYTICNGNSSTQWLDPEFLRKREPCWSTLAINPFMYNVKKWLNTLKILRWNHRNIFKVYLAFFQLGLLMLAFQRLSFKSYNKHCSGHFDVFPEGKTSMMDSIFLQSCSNFFKMTHHSLLLSNFCSLLHNKHSTAVTRRRSVKTFSKTWRSPLLETSLARISKVLSCEFPVNDSIELLWTAVY